MSEEQKPFRVDDRRHFTADGRPRSAEVAPSEPSEALPEVDFGAFILSLGSRAGLLLSGDGDEPEPGEPAARLR
jgi:hypothetical protein